MIRTIFLPIFKRVSVSLPSSQSPVVIVSPLYVVHQLLELKVCFQRAGFIQGA